jgi:hypothetical protein
MAGLSGHFFEADFRMLLAGRLELAWGSALAGRLTFSCFAKKK